MVFFVFVKEYCLYSMTLWIMILFVILSSLFFIWSMIILAPRWCSTNHSKYFYRNHLYTLIFLGSNLHTLTDRVVVLTNFICRTFLHIDMQKSEATTNCWYFYTLMVLNYSEKLFTFSNSLIGISNHWSKLSHIFHDHPYRLCCLQRVCIHLHHQVLSEESPCFIGSHRPLELCVITRWLNKSSI